MTLKQESWKPSKTIYKFVITRKNVVDSKTNKKAFYVSNVCICRDMPNEILSKLNLEKVSRIDGVMLDDEQDGVVFVSYNQNMLEMVCLGVRQSFDIISTWEQIFPEDREALTKEFEKQVNEAKYGYNNNLIKLKKKHSLFKEE